MTAAGEQTEPVAAPSDEQPTLFVLEPIPASVGLDDSIPPRPKRRRLRVVSQPLLRNLDPELDEFIAEAERTHPRSLGDCDRVVGDGPCPFVSCKMHLWSDGLDDDEVDDKLPRRMRWFEHLVETVHPDDWGETCAMRIAMRVVIEASETGKHEGHSADGEPIATPGPVLVGDPGRRRWEPVQGDFAVPRKVDAAVLGRFLGGLSREQIRKNLNAAAEKVRADPAMRQWAVDNDLDPDRVFEVDD